MTVDEALVALAHVVEPDDAAIGTLVERHGPERIVASIADGSLRVATAAALRERLRRLDLEQAFSDADRIGARIITRGSASWPLQLDDLGAGRPYALWVMGAADLRLNLVRSVSVVGTRASTAYGEEVTRAWCGELVDGGVAIVSGGAFGIDAAAHRAALASGGVTVCVLASGVDTPYPRSHEALIARIADEGLVVSESPLGMEARRHRFLTRNRIIAALTRATLIVESALRSGTTSTANHARALNRPLYAVPGPVTSPASAGCNDMIADGVALLASQPSVLLHTASGWSRPVGEPAAPRLPLDDLSPTQSLVLDAMPARGALEAGEIAVRAGLGIAAVMGALGCLEAMGLATLAPDGWRLAPRA